MLLIEVGFTPGPDSCVQLNAIFELPVAVATRAGTASVLDAAL